jgi:hypothetical protein
MNLIDKYVAEVGKHLPRKQRSDIERELKSTLEDMLDEQKQADGPASEAETIALLKEYGAPRDVAESYVGPRYLIGPRTYPIFSLIVKVVMAVLLGVGLFGYFTSTFITGEFIETGILSSFGKFWAGLLGGMINTFGYLVITFAFLERVLPATEFDEEEEWDPARLAREPGPDDVRVGESIAAIIFTVIGLIIFNLYPDVIGLYFNSNGEKIFVPILTDAFFTYLPWINLLGVLQIIFNFYLVRRRTWTVFTRVCNIALELGSIALAVVMLNGSALVEISPESLAATPFAEDAEIISKVLNFVPVMVLTIIIIVASIDVARTAYRLYNMRYRTSQG